MSDQSLRGFFTFVDCWGGGIFPRSEFDRALGGGPQAREIFRALARADIVSKAPYATTIECLEERRGCKGYVVREIPWPSRLQLVGVCSAKKRPCPEFPIEDEVSMLGQVALSARALGRALQRLFEIDGVSDLEKEDALMLLGEQEADDGNPRNVHFWASPDYQELLQTLRQLEQGRRRSLVLVPVNAGLFAAYGPGAHVEVGYLQDRVVLRDGVLAHASSDVPERAKSTEAPTIAPPTASPATVRLALDCERAEGAMVVSVNGTRLPIRDSYFALLVKLVSAEILEPGAWSSYEKVDIDEKHAETWYANRAFRPVVPVGFKVIVNDRKCQCRLNPKVVVERVDWATVAAHPSEKVRKIAALHLSRANGS